MDPSIEIRPLASRAELQACVDLQHATWGDGFSDVVPVSILKVAQRVGGVSAGAFDASNGLVGFVFGLTGVEQGRVVHWSDLLAVRPDVRNLGVGRRLKDYQRRRVRELGGSVIYWTYDPLIARNAHLNFNRLGVRLAEYAVDMYGVTDSVLHGGLPTDRLIVAWPTADDELRARVDACRHALSSDDYWRAPLVTEAWVAAAAPPSLTPLVRVEIPLDAERMFKDAPAEALAWRLRLRDTLRWALAAGYTVCAFHIDADAQRGYYLLDRSPPPSAGGHP